MSSVVIREDTKVWERVKDVSGRFWIMVRSGRRRCCIIGGCGV